MNSSDRLPWVVWLFAVVVLLYACSAGRQSEAPQIPRIQTRHLPPPTLHVEIPQLSNYNARDSCRRFDNQGRCREDDFVFGLAEQYHQAIDTDELVNKVEMKAGHVKVIGDADSAPVKLIKALQAQGIMADTPPEDREVFALLLRDLYHRP